MEEGVEKENVSFSWMWLYEVLKETSAASRISLWVRDGVNPTRERSTSSRGSQSNWALPLSNWMSKGIFHSRPYSGTSCTQCLPCHRLCLCLCIGIILQVALPSSHDSVSHCMFNTATVDVVWADFAFSFFFDFPCPLPPPPPPPPPSPPLHHLFVSILYLIWTPLILCFGRCFVFCF